MSLTIKLTQAYNMHILRQLGTTQPQRESNNRNEYFGA